MPDVDRPTITKIANDILQAFWAVIDESPALNGKDFCTVFSIVVYTICGTVATQVQQRPSVLWHQVAGVIAQEMEEQEQGEPEDGVKP